MYGLSTLLIAIGGRVVCLESHLLHGRNVVCCTESFILQLRRGEGLQVEGPDHGQGSRLGLRDTKSFSGLGKTASSACSLQGELAHRGAG